MRIERNPKASPRDLRAFYGHRDDGLSVEAAARRVGYSRSWGFVQEKRRYTQTSPTDGPTLQDAVRLVLALHHEEEAAFTSLMRAHGTNPVMQVHLGYVAERMAEYAANLAEQLAGNEIPVETPLRAMQEELKAAHE